MNKAQVNSIVEYHVLELPTSFEQSQLMAVFQLRYSTWRVPVSSGRFLHLVWKCADVHIRKGGDAETGVLYPRVLDFTNTDTHIAKMGPVIGMSRSLCLSNKSLRCNLKLCKIWEGGGRNDYRAREQELF